MSKRPVNLLIDDICEAIDQIASYTADMSFETFAADRKSIDAVVRNLEIIGEAANRLPDEFKESQSGIEWHKIVGLRNRVVHEYFGIDLEIIWQIISHDLPSLRRDLQHIRG